MTDGLWSVIQSPTVKNNKPNLPKKRLPETQQPLCSWYYIVILYLSCEKPKHVERYVHIVYILKILIHVLP